ncbi:hypothetical protein ASF84_23340 [Pseudomonas sp. Leaf127]|nr:hypothetical protein ASF84_23340 [Pseudomonas sp. Leaf127]
MNYHSRLISQGQHVVLELVGREVLHQRDQAGLVVDQQYDGVVLVQAAVGRGVGGLSGHGVDPLSESFEVR